MERERGERRGEKVDEIEGGGKGMKRIKKSFEERDVVLKNGKVGEGRAAVKIVDVAVPGAGRRSLDWHPCRSGKSKRERGPRLARARG